MQKLSGYTKLKVIAGYIGLVMLAVTAVLFTYQEILKLTEGERGISTMNRKLFITGNTITHLYEAEVSGNTFAQTGDKQQFNQYISSINRVRMNLDSLKGLTEEPNQQQRLDSINIFLHEKMDNLQALMRVKRLLVPEDFYDKALANIEASKDTIKEFLNIHRKAITTQDSSFIRNPKKRKGFLGIFGGKEADSVVKVTISHQTVVDTINSQVSDNTTDTIVSILKSVWTDIQQQTERIAQQINIKEYNITAKSNYISKQLRRILNEFEQEEIMNSVVKMEQHREAVRHFTTIIAWLAGIAFVLIITFLFFILRDISRGQQYRKELEKAKRYTEELLENREKMMLTVTHDIKSPLGSITGYIELLNNSKPTERQSYFLKNMKGSAEHILNLVTKLLDYAKLESNGVVPEEINYNPAHLLNEICESFIPQAQGKQLQLTHHIHEGLQAEYSGDALRIRQIVANILSNALKYTTTGSVELNATTSIAGDEMIIRIKDSGPGMSEEEQKLIFKEFARLSSPENQGAEGTGLGLTITRKLVHLLGGEILLESKPGAGSCFTVKIPLKKATLSSRVTTNEESVVLKKGLNILVVDDDRLQLEMTTALLKEKGVLVEATTNSAEVAEKVGTTQYDLILTDIQMPGTDGFELVRILRSIDSPKFPIPPIIALSARPDLNEKLYTDAGFSAYLNKPFTGNQLFAAIHRLVGSDLNPTEVPVTPCWNGDGFTLNNIAEFTDYEVGATQNIITVFIRETEKHLSILHEGTAEETQEVAHKMLPMFRQLECNEIVANLARLESKDAPPTEEESFKIKSDTIELCSNLLKVLAQYIQTL